MIEPAKSACQGKPATSGRAGGNSAQDPSFSGKQSLQRARAGTGKRCAHTSKPLAGTAATSLTEPPTVLLWLRRKQDPTIERHTRRLHSTTDPRSERLRDDGAEPAVDRGRHTKEFFLFIGSPQKRFRNSFVEHRFEKDFRQIEKLLEYPDRSARNRVFSYWRFFRANQEHQDPNGNLLW